MFFSAGAIRNAHGTLWPLVKGFGMLTGASSSLLPLKLIPHSGHSSGTKKQKMSFSQWLILITLLSMRDERGRGWTRWVLQDLLIHSAGVDAEEMEVRVFLQSDVYPSFVMFLSGYGSPQTYRTVVSVCTWASFNAHLQAANCNTNWQQVGCFYLTRLRNKTWMDWCTHMDVLLHWSQLFRVNRTRCITRIRIKLW